MMINRSESSWLNKHRVVFNILLQDSSSIQRPSQQNADISLSSLLGKNLSKESWAILNTGSSEESAGLWEGPFFLTDFWNLIVSHFQCIFDFSRESGGFTLCFTVHLSGPKHSSAFCIFVWCVWHICAAFAAHQRSFHTWSCLTEHWSLRASASQQEITWLLRQSLAG